MLHIWPNTKLLFKFQVWDLITTTVILILNSKNDITTGL